MMRDYANKQWLRDAIALENDLRKARRLDDLIVVAVVFALFLLTLFVW